MIESPSVFIYWITIPSMYLLLMIYSVFNLNDVSWGTREDAPQKPSEEEEKKKAEAKEKTKSSSRWDWLTGHSSKLAFWRRESQHREADILALKHVSRIIRHCWDVLKVSTYLSVIGVSSPVPHSNTGLKI